MIEQNTFRQVDEHTIVLDGLIWTINTDKRLNIKNNTTGHIVHSIKLDETHYYPCGIDRTNKNGNYSVIIEK